MLAEAGQCHGQVTYLWREAGSGRASGELALVAAASATLMGQLVWDASQRRDRSATNAYFDQAVAAARQAGDPVTAAWAQLRKSLVALYGVRDPQTGLSLAEEAAHVSRAASHVVTGLALLHVGEAHAMLGDRQRCEQLLSRADTHLGQVEAADSAALLYSPSHLGRMAGSCYLFLGKPKRAERLLESTARALQDRTKARAILLGNLALACIRQGKVDEATTILHEAIDVIELTRGGGGLNIAFAAARELKPWRDVPAVRDVHERLLTLMVAA